MLKKQNMKSSTLDSKTIVLLFFTLLTGLLAGVFFTWTNAITPGIGRLNDIDYLQAFQHMNRTILNPLFYIVITGPLLLSFVAVFLYKANTGFVLRLLSATAIIYFLGVFIVTILGNIPLNDLLDKTDLKIISVEGAKSLRDRFETKWNNLHLIRTISSSTSFLLLIVACLFRPNDNNTKQSKN